MIKKLYVIGVLGVASLLLGSLVVTNVIPGQTSSSGYDPWLDYNDDGVIDVYDLQALGHAYGSTGTPLNMPMALAYDSGWLNISDLQGQNVTVTHNLNLAPETDFVQTVYGKTLPESEVHQTCLVGTSYAPGWNETYDSNLRAGMVAHVNVARSVVQTSDGGYAMAGFTWNSTQNCYSWLVKTDSAGNHLWNKTYGATNDCAAHSLVQTDDGGYAWAGGVKVYVAGGWWWDFWLVKTYSNGTVQWNKTYEYPDPYEFDEDIAYSLVQTDDGGYALAGYTNLWSSSDIGDFWLVKTDEFGNMQWNKKYEGYKYDYAYSLVQTSDGYAIAGSTSDGGGFLGQDFWLVKTNLDGDVEWNKTYSGPHGGYDCPYSLVETSDEGYALAGYTHDYENANYSILLVKTNVSGEHQWNRTYNWGPKFDCAFSLVQTGDGGYAMIGCADATVSPPTHDGVTEDLFSPDYPRATYSDYWLVKTDSAGNMQWNRTFGDKGSSETEVAYSMVMTADGGFAIAGTNRLSGVGFLGWLVKTDAFGLCSRAVEVFEFGLAVVEITANTLTLYRGKIDPYWNYVRVRIWVAKPNP